MVYASSTLSLAMLELLVHLEADDILSEFYCRISVLFPKKETLKIGDLPTHWNTDPPPAFTRALGDAWIKGATSLALVVPSAIVPVENNYLINPQHPAYKKVKIGKPEALA